MNLLILSPEQMSQLQSLNATGAPERQLQPVDLLDGRKALNADLLTDCAPGATWEHYAPFLAELTLATVAPSAFPKII